MKNRKIVFIILLALPLISAVSGVSALSSALGSLCSGLTSMLPVAAMLMTVLAAVIYAAGQMMGAETRARANTWATAALTGAMMAILISVVSPSVIGAVYGSDISCSGGSGTSCFLPGTLVQTPSGEVPIEEIKIGDMAYSFSENGEVSVSGVSAKYIAERDFYYTIAAGEYSVNATAEHPFLTPNGYKDAGDLAEGDIIFIYQNEVLSEKAITMVSRVNESATVYNLQVDTDHTFFANGFAVHNKQNCVAPLISCASGCKTAMTCNACGAGTVCCQCTGLCIPQAATCS